MALRSEKACFEKNVRQEHEADCIFVLSVPLLRLCSEPALSLPKGRRVWQIKNSVNLCKSVSKTSVLFPGEYLCDLGVYPERSRMGALWLIRKAVLVCDNPCLHNLEFICVFCAFSWLYLAV
jgi:hypothetical protein